MDDKTMQLNVVRLCSVWLHFLDHAGKYAARYYMSRDLELPPSEQDPATHTAMVKHYGTEKNLLGTIQRDLDTFPEELKAINAAQIACELPGFSERDEYLAQIVMGFTMLDRHGKERRAYYRRIVNKDLKTLNGGGNLWRVLSTSSRLASKNVREKPQLVRPSVRKRSSNFTSQSRLRPAHFIVDFSVLWYNEFNQKKHKRQATLD